jgi:hypothetical protein
MNFLTLLPFFGTLLDRLLPDPAANAAAKLKLLEMQQSGDLAKLAADTDLAKGQLAINQVEAASTRLFVAGWRPFIGWICGFVLGFKYIGGPLLVMVSQAAGHPVTPPDLGLTDLLPVLGAMLGLGTMRTVEKVQGVA